MELVIGGVDCYSRNLSTETRKVQVEATCSSVRVFFGAIAATAVTLTAAVTSPSGGTYIVFIGALVVGVGEFFYGIELWYANRDPLARAPLELKILMRALIDAAVIHGPLDKFAFRRIQKLDKFAIRRIQKELKRIRGRKYRPAVIKRAARAMDRNWAVSTTRFLEENEMRLSLAFKQSVLNGCAAITKGGTPTRQIDFLRTMQSALRVSDKDFRISAG
jgi:hypothetical protein